MFDGLFGGASSGAAPKVSAGPFTGLFAGQRAQAKAVNIGKQAEQVAVKQQTKPIATTPAPKSFLSKLGGVASTFSNGAVKDVTNAPKTIDKAASAIARPVADVATGQVGKATHDTAQLSSDATGGSVNQLAKAAVATPLAIDREVHNKPIGDIQQKVFGTTDPGAIAKKIVGSTVGTAALFAGGGEAKGVAAGEDALSKGLIENALAGAVSNVGSQITKNPNSSVKNLAESAGEGAIGGVVLTGGAKVLGDVGSNLKTAAGKNTSVNDLINNTRIQGAADHSPAESPTAPKTTSTPINDVTPGSAGKGISAPLDHLRMNSDAPSNNPVPENLKMGNVLSEQETAPKTTKLDEAGGIPVGQVVDNVQGMIAKHQAVQKATGDIEHDYAVNQGRTTDVKLDTANVLKNRAPLSDTDKQTLQNYRDMKATGQTPDALPAHLQQANDDITALNKAAQANDAEKARLTGDEAKAQSIEARDPETYTHRIAQGKGSKLELTGRGDTNNPLSVGSLSKTTASSKKQVYQAITDEDGNRRIVAVKNKVLKDENGGKTVQGKQVTAMRDGGAVKHQLGTLRLKDNQDFLDKELKPYQTKIANLQKEGDALSKVKTKGGVSDARITNLARKVSLLEDPGNMDTLSASEARSLQQAKIKLKELTNVKDPSTNVEGRLKTINQHLINMNNEVGRISNKYDSDTLDNKSFVANDGKKYTIGQATQDEITKATGQKYYVDPELTSHLNYADSKVSLENTRFVENTKSILEDKQLAYKEGETAPKNFQPTTNPYFRGYKLDPKIAEQLDDISTKKSGVLGGGINKLGSFLRQTIVYLPIKHNFNELAGFAIDRGLTRSINPLTYPRLAVDLFSSAKSVATQDDFYRQVLQHGGNLMGADDKQLGRVVAKQIKGTLSTPSRVAGFAKAFGMSPVRAYKALQHVSVFDVQDILNLTRIKENMHGTLLTKGMNLEDAMNKTDKFNFQYKVPSRVALPGKLGRASSEALNSKGVYFGAYTYDKFRIAKNILKTTANIAHPKEAIQAADKLAATVAIAAVLWPQVDKGLQKVTGDKNAHFTAPGIASIPEVVQKVLSGKESPTDAAGSQVSVAAPITIGSQLLGNTNSFTGAKISDPNASLATRAGQTLSFLKGQLAPSEKLSTVKNASSNKTLSTFLSLAGASLPKSSPGDTKLESLKYDSLPFAQSEAKALAAKGDVHGAIDRITLYNAQVTKAVQAAAKADGKPIPTAAQIKTQGYYYDPKLSTVQGWAKTKPSTGLLSQILNTKTKPAKGTAAYGPYEQAKSEKAAQTKIYNEEHPNEKQPVETLP